MEERQKSNKFWVCLFCFCLIIIVSLIIAIAVLRSGEDEDKDSQAHNCDNSSVSDDCDGGNITDEPLVDFYTSEGYRSIKSPGTGPGEEDESSD